MPATEQWRGRLHTAQAMALLCWARLLVAFVPFDRWRGSLGSDGPARLADAQHEAKLVEWAATRLPFTTRCLPRAMALSWMLNRQRLGHTVVIAVRAPDTRGSDDDLHAWVEVAGETIIGDLPGPWVETLRLGR
ncbi:MAG TPA: lasso peptide biosynthesis B2 protein [Sphingomicrobium sp.]